MEDTLERFDMAHDHRTHARSPESRPMRVHGQTLRHPVEQLKAAIQSQIPGVSVEIDRPRSEDGEWWLDIVSGEFRDSVAWRPRFGFGIFTSEEYGDRPSEIYSDVEQTSKRIRQLWDQRVANSLRCDGISLREIRQIIGITQTKLAETLDVNPEVVSRQEKRDDPKVSTLAAYIHAMGGRLEVRVRFDTFEAELAIPQLSIALASEEASHDVYQPHMHSRFKP